MLRRRSPEPSATEVLAGVSPERRATAEPNVQLALEFLRGHRALCAALEQQHALDKAPKAIDARLEQLWEALQPELPYVRHDEEWARLGFQGHDPTTDLRGGGGLALCELLHLVAHRPALCAHLVDAWSELSSPTRQTQLRSLPLALTSIHATSWLRALLEDGLLERSLLAHGPPRDFTELLPRYRELFVELFEGFVAEWCAQPHSTPLHTSTHLCATAPARLHACTACLNRIYAVDTSLHASAPLHLCTPAPPHPRTPLQGAPRTRERDALRGGRCRLRPARAPGAAVRQDAERDAGRSDG